METRKVTGLSGLESDMVALGFQGRRHIMCYVIRIMLPMLVLVVVSWAVFFLDEYRKRIEIAGANLLMFIAFNWVISDDLPKLGYLTFLDFILQWMFVVSGAIVVFSVVLSRLKWSGREVMARRLVNYAVKWVYPLGYAGVVAFAVSKYLVIGQGRNITQKTRKRRAGHWTLAAQILNLPPCCAIPSNVCCR